MAGREPDTGPTAFAVAANVKRLRKEQNLNYTQLSERMQQITGWWINAVGIRRIESGERKVTPDDLMALARALGVWPITLLMPHTQAGGDAIVATGLPESVTAEKFWGWLQAADGLYRGSDEWVETMHRGQPTWKVREHYEAAYRSATQQNRMQDDALGTLAARMAEEYGDD